MKNLKLLVLFFCISVSLYGIEWDFTYSESELGNPNWPNTVNGVYCTNLRYPDKGLYRLDWFFYLDVTPENTEKVEKYFSNLQREVPHWTLKSMDSDWGTIPEIWCSFIRTYKGSRFINNKVGESIYIIISKDLGPYCSVKTEDGKNWVTALIRVDTIQHPRDKSWKTRVYSIALFRSLDKDWHSVRDLLGTGFSDALVFVRYN